MAKVKKIVIEVGKRELSLTPEEARSLRDALDDVMDMKTVPVPYPVPARPYWPYFERRYWADVKPLSITSRDFGPTRWISSDSQADLS